MSWLAKGHEWWAGGAAVTGKVGGFRVGMADRHSQDGWGSSSRFACFSTDPQLRLSAHSGILQSRLNLLVSVVSVWSESDRFIPSPFPNSPTVITVFTK